LAWRFRKSARLPLGFRLNASKSGLGFSWGFRGFRIGRDAKGRTVRTLSIPGTGVFNRQVISTARSRATFVTVNSRGVGYQQRTENLEPDLEPQSEMHLQRDSVFHVPLSELAASNQSEFVARLNDNVSAFNLGPVLIALSVFALLLAFSNFILGIVLFFLGLGLGIFVSKRFAESHTEEINFSLDQDSAEHFRARQQALSVLTSCARIWVVNTSASNVDAKRNAGARTLITRGPAAVGNLPTRGFKCSPPILSISANNIVLHFLPDQLLIYTGRYGSISYAQLSIEARSTQFTETEAIPGDSQRIGTTWQYARKDGGPDHRYNNNRQMPVLEYGEVTFRTATGLEITLQTSNSGKAKAFAAQFSAVLLYNTIPLIADDSSHGDRRDDLGYEDPCHEAFHEKAEREAARSNLPSRTGSGGLEEHLRNWKELEPGQHQDPPLASLPSSVPFPARIPPTPSNPVEMPRPSVNPNLQGELHPSTSDLDTLSVEINIALSELSVPLKEELRQYRLAGGARDLLDLEISRMITRTGFDGTHYTARAVDFSLSLKRQAHPKSMHSLQREGLAQVMDETIQKNRNLYLPQKMKPDLLRYFQSYDGKHGTQFAAQAAELFLKVAAAAATENGTIPEPKRIVLEQLTLECKS
jgi:hypothetical protein